jgi:hypothetical protein
MFSPSFRPVCHCINRLVGQFMKIGEPRRFKMPRQLNTTIDILKYAWLSNADPMRATNCVYILSVGDSYSPHPEITITRKHVFNIDQRGIDPSLDPSLGRR